LETVGALIVINAIVAGRRTSVSAFTFAIERAIGIGTASVDIAIVRANTALVNVNANGPKVTGIGMQMAAIVELAHVGGPWFIAGITRASVTAGAIPLVVVA